MMHAPIYIVHNESMGLTDYGLTGTVSIVSVVTIFQYHLCNKIHFVPVYVTIYWEYCPQTGSLYVHFSLTLNTRKLTKEFINWVVGTSVPASLVPAVATSVGDWNCQVPADVDVRMNGIYTDCRVTPRLLHLQKKYHFTDRMRLPISHFTICLRYFLGRWNIYEHPEVPVAFSFNIQRRAPGVFNNSSRLRQ